MSTSFPGRKIQLYPSSLPHYKNKPIQIYWKFHHQNMKIFRCEIFHISAQNIDCEYLLEPPRRGGFN